MGEYQEWAVHFECKRKDLDKLLSLCEDVGIEISETDIWESEKGKGRMIIDHYGEDTARWSFPDGLVELKKKLIESGAEEVSVRHAWPSELIEVEEKERGKL